MPDLFFRQQFVQFRQGIDIQPIDLGDRTNLDFRDNRQIERRQGLDK